MTIPLDNYYAVIMAGGGGTRLWPLSRHDRPKQVLDLLDHKPLFNIAVDRLQGLFAPDHIYVVTVQEQADQFMKLCPVIPPENYIIEPFPKDTASVVGLAAAVLQHKQEDAVMVILTADHYIEDVSRFQKVLLAGYELARQDHLVTLGIQPAFASTGFGYIQRGDPLGEAEGFKTFRVVRFREKPLQADAENFISRGDHDWNSGMFIWKTSVILNEIERQMPELYAILTEIRTLLANSDWNRLIAGAWGKIKPLSIDYGIMEHARNVAVIPVAGLGWNDVGSWDNLFDVLPADNHGNIIHHNDHIGIDSRNVLLVTRNAKRLIVTIGVQDLIVVDTGDTLMICSRDAAQHVRQVVNQLKNDKREEYL